MTGDGSVFSGTHLCHEGLALAGPLHVPPGGIVIEALSPLGVFDQLREFFGGDFRRRRVVDQADRLRAQAEIIADLLFHFFLSGDPGCVFFQRA